MSDTGVLARRPYHRMGRTVGGAVGFGLAVILGLLAGYGWLYLLSGAGWLAAGPRVSDSLPLLQLAGFDGQPLARVLAAWVLAGGLAGLALRRLTRPRRTVIAAVLGLALLLLAAQASYAVARNLRFADIVLSREPGLGPWLEGLVFAAGCALPRGPVAGTQRRRRRRAAVAGKLDGLRQFGLRGREHWDAAEHDRDRDQVGSDRDGVRA